MAYSNNHYVPQFIQRRFGDKINRYNVQTGEIKVKGSILNAFSGKNIYPEWLEHMFSKLEAKMATLIDKKILNADKVVTITREDNLLIKKFFTVAMLRVPESSRRESKIDEELEQDESEKTESRKTTATLRKTSKEERTALVNWYGGKCQICGTVIKKKNGEPYFEATDIVPMGKLKEEYDQHNGLCWNSLCLCPNCSAKYQVSPKNINAIANICDTEFDFTDDEMHPLEIELAGEHVTIRFTSKHLQAIQVAQKKFKK